MKRLIVLAITFILLCGSYAANADEGKSPEESFWNKGYESPIDRIIKERREKRREIELARYSKETGKPYVDPCEKKTEPGCKDEVLVEKQPPVAGAMANEKPPEAVSAGLKEASFIEEVKKDSAASSPGGLVADNSTKTSADSIQADLNRSQRIWGSFPEMSMWTGAWKNFKYDTWGWWGNLDYMQWFTRYEKPENFGVGINARGDYGQTKDGKFDWGYGAVGPQVGYYRGLGLRDSFLAKAGLLYRFDLNRDNGLMPVAHLEFNHLFDYKNRGTFQVDGSYFPGDSWLGPGLYWEHKLAKKWKVTLGAGASLAWTDGDFFAGFMPSLKFKYNNRFTLGVSANLFTGLGPFGGIIAAYELTPDMNTWYQKYKKDTIKKVQKGEMKAPEGFDMKDPIVEEIWISEKTIEEMDNEKGGK